jgi:hypothetical protein
MDNEGLETTEMVVTTDHLELVYPKIIVPLGRHIARTVDGVAVHR